ncbi:MAG: fibrobacter succinogenes major paralogous domain-containing protein [Chitinophagaceae bacterium]
MSTKIIFLAFPVSIFLCFIGCITDDTSRSVTDIDGNVYPVVKIGNQVWMAENLRVTRFRNGDKIPHITTDSGWSNTLEAAFCSYGNDTINTQIYGGLYNWYAVNDKRKIAPKGWHIPTIDEITILINTLKGDTVAGGLMKVTDHWLFPNTGANNASGFSALPGGYRYGKDGSFHTLSSNGYWWHTTGSYELFCWSNRFYNYFAETGRDPQYYNYGFSIRCVKD